MDSRIVDQQAICRGLPQDCSRRLATTRPMIQRLRLTGEFIALIYLENARVPQMSLQKIQMRGENGLLPRKRRR